MSVVWTLEFSKVPIEGEITPVHSWHIRLSSGAEVLLIRCPWQLYWKQNGCVVRWPERYLTTLWSMMTLLIHARHFFIAMFLIDSPPLKMGDTGSNWLLFPLLNLYSSDFQYNSLSVYLRTLSRSLQLPKTRPTSNPRLSVLRRNCTN